MGEREDAVRKVVEAYKLRKLTGRRKLTEAEAEQALRDQMQQSNQTPPSTT